jgi:hypothetical protein
LTDPTPTNDATSSPYTAAFNEFQVAIRRSTISRTFIVAGMRRSGNHAIINWLANALEGTATEFRYVTTGVIGISTSGRTAHANDLTLDPYSEYFDLAVDHLRLFSAADSLILSFEDWTINGHFERLLDAPSTVRRVYVQRSTLNTLASRLQALKQNQHSDRTNSGLEITQEMLDAMLSNRVALPAGWTVIDFDRWLTEGSPFRRAILYDLDLDVDIEPPISTVAQGSSFTFRERVPTSAELTSRLTSIIWPEDLVELLLRPRNFDLLTADEVEFLLNAPPNT